MTATSLPRPCPTCGRVPTVACDGWNWSVTCSTCVDLGFPVGNCPAWARDGQEGAIAMWNELVDERNTRATTPAASTPPADDA